MVVNHGATLRLQLVDNYGKVYCTVPFTYRKDYPWQDLASAQERFSMKVHDAISNIQKDSQLVESLSDTALAEEAKRRGWNIIWE